MELQTIYEQIGGDGAIRKIVDTFYPKVYQDETLSPLFAGDINEIKMKQRLFLTQLTGGGTLYSDQFGPPNMRARHMPFEITPSRAKAWLKLMHETLNETGLLETEGGKALFQRLSQIAPIMVNKMEG